MSDDINLDEIERRVNAATDAASWESAANLFHLLKCGVLWDVWRVAARQEDADFIAYARTDVPALVAEVRRLRERIHNKDGHVEALRGILTRTANALKGWATVLMPHSWHDDLPEVAAKLRAERDHWKANHAEMVKRNDVLRDRPDLPAEKVKPRLAILDEIDQIRRDLNRAREDTGAVLKDWGRVCVENTALRAKVAAGDKLAEAAECARATHDGKMFPMKCECGDCEKTEDALADWREAGKDGTK